MYRSELVRPAAFGTVALALTLALLAAASGHGSTSTAPAMAGSSGPPVKVEPRVFEQIAGSGEATFWVLLRERADLRSALVPPGRPARTAFVFQRLTSLAATSQERTRALLRRRGAAYEPFWIVNAIRVTAGSSVLLDLASLPEVERIVADRRLELSEPQADDSVGAVDGVEWNIDRINATRVWSELGTRGDGIVVANIDSGAQYDHPALVRQYRGRNADGTFSHDYNWFDPSGICGSPSLSPCDNNGHGTHTMGTIVGGDGSQRIGVAPDARWIAAKGCETSSCSLSAILAAGQWVIAPTDVNGQNPRPDLAPDIVNNSWGGAPDWFFLDVVEAWVAAGIFPAFAIGNGGPDCSSTGSPGNYAGSYGVGAFDIDNAIASFSARGPFDGRIKPDLAAPGVSVRSSVPGDAYATYSGTSMATPHVAGTVALLWSENEAIRGDVGSTFAALDDAAIDVHDTSCGGSGDDNNTWGEGRLDAYATVSNAPRAFGVLSGTVTEDVLENPIVGATITLVGPSGRTTTTSVGGGYRISLGVGTYEATASADGYVSLTATVVVGEGTTTTQDFALALEQAQAPGPQRLHSFSGDLDRTFGVGGIVRSDFTFWDTVNDVALQPDGKVVVVGSGDAWPASGPRERPLVARYTAEGRRDESFATRGFALLDVPREALLHAVALQADGKIVAAGGLWRSSDRYDSTAAYDFLLLRFDPDGTLDATFGDGGVVVTGFGSTPDAGGFAGDVAIQPDGKIVAAGHVARRDPAASNDFAIVRVHPDGSLDRSFGTGGKATVDIGASDWASAVALQRDGRILLAGFTCCLAPRYDFDLGVARLRADGALDATFGDGGRVRTNLGVVETPWFVARSSEVANALAVQGDGKIVVAGWTNLEGGFWGVTDFALVRYDASGALDSSFGKGGTVLTDFHNGFDWAYDVLVQPDGKIVTAGETQWPGVDHFFGLARFEANGRPDLSFGARALRGKVITDGWVARAVAMQPDGKLLAAGGLRDVSLARYHNGVVRGP